MAQRVGKHSGSETSFADAIGVGRSTANGWIEGTTRRETFDTDQSNRIAERFQFPADWEPWLIKSADVFKEEFDKRAKAFLNTPSADGPLRDTSQMLMPGPEPDIERSKIAGLASLQLVCGNTERGQTNIGAIVSCGDAEIPGSQFRMTLSAAILLIDCGKARAEPSSVKGTEAGARRRFRMKGTDGEVVATWTGDMQMLRWNLDAVAISIGTVRFDDDMLARVVSLAPGDDINGSLGAYLKDISGDIGSPPNPSSAVGILDRFGDSAALDEHGLSTLQRLAIEHLRKAALTEVDEQGFAILARHALTFIKRPE